MVGGITKYGDYLHLRFKRMMADPQILSLMLALLI